MRKNVCLLFALALLSLAVSLTAGPLSVPAPAAWNAPAPQAPAGVLDVFKPLWMIGGNCWNNRQRCQAACDPQDNQCLLGCECEYCYCANLEPPLECSFGGGNN